MKRFLILTQYFEPEIGASQSRLAALARELSRLGHGVEIVTAFPHHLRGMVFGGYEGRFSAKETWEGVPLHRSWVYVARDSASWRRLLNYGSFALTSLLGLFRSARPDFLFVESPPLFLALPAVLYSRMRRVPIILNVADLWPDSVRMLGVMDNELLLNLGGRLEHWAYRRARYVNAVTEGIRASLLSQKRLPASKVLFLPNGVDVEQFHPQEPDEQLVRRYGLEDKKVFLYAGTHGLAYRLDLLVECALRMHRPDIVFMIVGDGYTKAPLQELVASSKLPNVLLVDSQPAADMPRYFSVAHASVIPFARNELFRGTRPAKMFPSLAAGVPAIYSGEGEGADLLLESQAGIVTPPEDVDALMQAVLRIADDATLHEEMSRKGRAYALTRFSWRHPVEQWVDSIEQREGAAGTPW